MRVIKRYVKQDNGGYRLAVWTNTYVHTLDHVLYLSEFLTEVDPEIEYDTIDVLVYGGDRYSGMTAVECNTTIQPDDSWEEAGRLEYTR